MDRVFGIIPASSGPVWFAVGIAVVLFLVMALMAFIAYSSRNVRFEVNDEGLRISPSVYGRFIPRGEIAAEGVMVLDLRAESAYVPKSRTNGAGLPGYSEGWFKLKNGEKALVFLTDRSSVVYIPTTKDYSVLLSVRDAEEFSGLIRQWEQGR